jgi:site-specific recombinase XerD
MAPKIKLLAQMRLVLRLKHLSLRTEHAYITWAKRFIVLHGTRHPKDRGAEEIRAFLTHLALHRHVAASTQNVALHALLFLDRDVLPQAFPHLGAFARAKRPPRLPTVLSRAEVAVILAQLAGVRSLMARLLYGAGLRLMECLCLRVNDVDCTCHQIVVRSGKGEQDRMTLVPRTIEDTLQRHLTAVKRLHEADLAEGSGAVYLPYAVATKDHHAGTSWGWQ